MSKKMGWAKLAPRQIPEFLQVFWYALLNPTTSLFHNVTGIKSHILKLLLCGIVLEVKVSTILSLKNFVKNKNQKTENHWELLQLLFILWIFSASVNSIKVSLTTCMILLFFRKKSWRRPFWWCLQISRTWNRLWLPQKWQMPLAYQLWRTENGRYSKPLRLKAQGLMKQWSGE